MLALAMVLVEVEVEVATVTVVGGDHPWTWRPIGFSSGSAMEEASRPLSLPVVVVLAAMRSCKSLCHL